MVTSLWESWVKITLHGLLIFYLNSDSSAMQLDPQICMAITAIDLTGSHFRTVQWVKADQIAINYSLITLCIDTDIFQSDIFTSCQDLCISWPAYSSHSISIFFLSGTDSVFKDEEEKTIYSVSCTRCSLHAQGMSLNHLTAQHHKSCIRTWRNSL